MLLRIDASLTEDALSRHGGLNNEKEKTEDSERCRNSHPQTRRLLQQSEESRHAITDQRQEGLAVETAPSHQHDGCTATRTHLGNPEDAS